MNYDDDRLRLTDDDRAVTDWLIEKMSQFSTAELREISNKFALMKIMEDFRRRAELDERRIQNGKDFI